MKRNITFLLSLTLVLTISCKKNKAGGGNTNDQSSFASAAVINQRLGRGINLGDTYESSWSSKEADPADFKRMAESGFKTVRIPIRWELPSRTTYTSPYVIAPSFLSKIKTAVDEALKNKLHVIINMHHHDSLFVNADAMKPMFIAQWQQIAAYFKNYPDSLLFEVMNEPNGNLDAVRWNTFFADALTEIRKTNPKRTVFLGLAEWGGVSAISKLTVPNDSHLILTVHYYNPFQFTHQGASWVSGSDAWLGTKWNDTEYDRQSIDDDFKAVIQFAKEKNIPVNVGEFGAYSTGDMSSRVKWTRYLARWFEQQGFSWNYWEFNSGFGIYDPVTAQYRTELLNALTKDAMISPAPVTLVNLYSSNFSNSQNDGWNLYNNDPSAASTMAVANNKLTVTITSPGTQTWFLQLIRSNTAIETGKIYRVVFNAYSAANRNIIVDVMQSAAPWISYGSKSFGITSSDAVYSFVFTATATNANCNFVFSLGNNGLSPVTLSNIILQEVKL